MQNYIVLFRDNTVNFLAEPLGFQCFAEDVEHAEEQCENAYPGCNIVYVWSGEYGIGIDAALEEYYNM